MALHFLLLTRGYVSVYVRSISCKLTIQVEEIRMLVWGVSFRILSWERGYDPKPLQSQGEG